MNPYRCCVKLRRQRGTGRSHKNSGDFASVPAKEGSLKEDEKMERRRDKRETECRRVIDHSHFVIFIAGHPGVSQSFEVDPWQSRRPEGNLPTAGARSRNKIDDRGKEKLLISSSWLLRLRSLR